MTVFRLESTMFDSEKILSSGSLFDSVSAKKASVLDLMNICLRSVCQKYDFEFILADNRWCNILANSATSVYLINWLWSDKTAVDSFSHYMDTNVFSNVEKANCYNDRRGSVYSKMRRSAQNVREIHFLVDKQTSLDGLPPIKRYNTPDSKGNSDKWHCLDFWQIVNSDKLIIIDLLLDYKRILGITTEKDKNDSLQNAYKEYYDLFKSITPDSAGTMDDRTYVITAMMLHQIEYTYRFHLAALMARLNRTGFSTALFGTLDQKIASLWLPVAKVEGDPLFTGKEDYIFPYISYDVLCYVPELLNLFSENHLLNEEAYFRHYSSIIVLRNMLLLAMNNVPPEKLPSWTQDDFSKAKLFYLNDYPIYKIFEQACEPDPDNNLFWDFLEKEEETEENRKALKDIPCFLLPLGIQNKKAPHNTLYDYIRSLFTYLIDYPRDEFYNPDGIGRFAYQDHMDKFRVQQRSKSPKSRSSK